VSALQRRAVIHKSRVIGLAVVIGLVFVLYAVHLFEMQVLDGYFYLLRARQTASRSEPIFARRGEIFDHTGTEALASNRTSFALNIVPSEVPPGRLEELINELAELVDRDPRGMLDRISRRRGSSAQSIEIVSGLNLTELTRVAERIQEFPGVSWYTKPERLYPHGDLTSHVVGYVGEITPQELQILFNEGYTSTSIIGKSGIEQQYDQLLRGDDGRRFRTVDARGQRVGTEDEVLPPEEGMQLVLSIDIDLQRLAQEALGPRVGSVVAMRPASGEILAMVNYPRYNPNLFAGPSGNTIVRQLSLDRRAPFLNRAIQSVAAPASTFKILMTTAILEEEAFSPEQHIQCTGTFAYGNRVFNDWLEYGHGLVNLHDALAQSCNVYYWTMGSQYLSVDQIIDYSGRLGLGRPTGIDLPREVAGLVPSPTWKEETYNVRWVGGDTVNMSIGEGFLQVTPLQLASMVSTIVNDGVTYRPQVLREIRDPVTGGTVETVQPEVVREADISRETLEAVRESMRGVITEGTANVVITTDAVESAGKTGTGEVGAEENWTSWFVAYAPYGDDVPEEERIVLVVMVDASNEWEWWAPKAANIILHGYFKGLEFDEAVMDLRRGPRPIWYM
jgi:penicillin-binding protein 2